MGKNQCPDTGVGFFVDCGWLFGFGSDESDIGQRGEVVMAKPRIFVRENGKGKHRYTVVAAQGGDIHFYKDRYSKAELELIARETDTELLFIKGGEDIAIDEEDQAPESGEEPEDVE